MRSSWILALSLLIVGCAGAPKLMETPNLYVGSPTDPFADVPSVLQSPFVSILYATDRKPETDDDGRPGYGEDRCPSLAVGDCRVRIGEDETWGQVVRASRSKDRVRRLPLSVAEIVERARFAKTPHLFDRQGDRVIPDEEALATDEAATKVFHDMLRSRLADTPRKEVYVYVHGVDNEFEDAATVLAELWHFFGRTGVPVVYTWPAGKGYAYDRESSEFTIHHFKMFIGALAACPEVEKIHLVSHSRGTDVVSTGVRELVVEARASGKDPAKEFRIGHLVLLAADLDWDVVNQRSATERVFDVVERLTIYVSKEDLAIKVATWFFESRRRVGILRPEDLTPRQRDVIEKIGNIDFVTADVASGFLGHSYFHESPAASSDLILLLRDGKPPGAEHGRPLEQLDAHFWSFDDGYMRSK